MAQRLFNSLTKLGIGVAIAGGIVNTALYNGKAQTILYMYWKLEMLAEKFSGLKYNSVYCLCFNENNTIYALLERLYFILTLTNQLNTDYLQVATYS